MSESKKSFVTGAAILSIAGLLVKIVGAFYKIWLVGLIGSEGTAFFSYPYSIYTWLLVLSSAGLPTAISKMVSEQISRGNALGAKTILIKSRRILLFTGLAATALMMALAVPLSTAMGDPQAAPGFVALAPSLLFVCLFSAYRGYFQGHQNMVPTAFSQVVEQIGKVVLGFGLAIAMQPKGVVWGAVGAILGVTISEFLAFVFIYIYYLLHKKKTAAIQASGNGQVEHFYKRLFAIAIPVIIGSSVMPLVNIVDTSLVVNRLLDAGYAIETARSMYGILSTSVMSIVNMPTVITIAIATAMVPAVSSAKAIGDTSGLQKTVSTGIKLAIMIGSACTVGLGLLSGGVFSLLFKRSLSASEVLLGSELLAGMSVVVFFVAIVQTSTAILQGLGKPFYPVYTLLAGIVVKIFLNYILIGNPSFNVNGAVIASVCCYAIAAVGNLFFVIRFSGIRFSFVQFILKPALALTGMALTVWLVQFAGPILGESLTTLAAVGIGALVYGILALLLGCLNKDDLGFVPGGRRLTRLLQKLHVRI